MNAPTIFFMQDALYIPDGDGFISTEFTRGPWSPDSQHGGPPAALLIRAAEQASPPRMAVTRATIEFLTPVPIAPLHVETQVLRPGKRVQLIGASLRTGTDEVARLTALLIRTNDSLTIPEPLHDTSPLPPPDEATRDPFYEFDYRHFAADAVEVRYVDRSPAEPGPSKVWIRLKVPLVAGETPSPTQRVSIAADSGNGVSWEIDFATHLFVNPDLTIYLHREPVGEWILIDAVTDLGTGIGLAQSALYDTTGPIGRSLQSLYVDSR